MACLCAPVHAGSLCAFRVLFAVLMMLTRSASVRPCAPRDAADPMACVFSMLAFARHGRVPPSLVAMSACFCCSPRASPCAPQTRVLRQLLVLVFAAKAPVEQPQLFVRHRVDAPDVHGHDSDLLFERAVSTKVVPGELLLPLPSSRRSRRKQTPEPRGRGHETPPPVYPSLAAPANPRAPFIVYFIAGCKVWLADWFGHQSMTDLSSKAIFQGFMFPYVCNKFVALDGDGLARRVGKRGCCDGR